MQTGPTQRFHPTKPTDGFMQHDDATTSGQNTPQTVGEFGLDGSIAKSLALEIGQHTMKGLYHPNEDRLAVWPDLRGTWTDSPVAPALRHRLTLLLLCDGHDGSQCATFIQTHFVNHLRRVLATQVHPGVSKVSWDFPSALSATFLSVEAAWTDHVKQLRSSRGFAPPNGVTSGACLTAVLLYGSAVHVANVGDARCVVRRANGAIQDCTTDHRCNDEVEKARILAAGGYIRNNRVLGVLEPTRTIGDLEEKDRCPPGVLIAQPSTTSTVLLEDDVSTAQEVAAAQAELEAELAQLLAEHGMSRSAAGRGRGGAQRRRGGHVQVPALSTQAQEGKGSLQARLQPQTLTALVARLAAGPGGRGGLARRGRAFGGQTGNMLQGPWSGQAPQGNSSMLPSPFTLPEALASSSALPTSLLIVASDGVWDVLSSAQAAAVVVHALAVHNDATAAARELCSMALRYGSADDITCAVVVLSNAGKGGVQPGAVPALGASSNNINSNKENSGVAAAVQHANQHHSHGRAQPSGEPAKGQGQHEQQHPMHVDGAVQPSVPGFAAATNTVSQLLRLPSLGSLGTTSGMGTSMGSTVTKGGPTAGTAAVLSGLGASLGSLASAAGFGKGLGAALAATMPVPVPAVTTNGSTGQQPNGSTAVAHGTASQAKSYTAIGPLTASVLKRDRDGLTAAQASAIANGMAVPGHHPPPAAVGAGDARSPGPAARANAAAQATKGQGSVSA